MISSGHVRGHRHWLDQRRSRDDSNATVAGIATAMEGHDDRVAQLEEEMEEVLTQKPAARVQQAPTSLSTSSAPSRSWVSDPNIAGNAARQWCLGNPGMPFVRGWSAFGNAPSTKISKE